VDHVHLTDEGSQEVAKITAQHISHLFETKRAALNVSEQTAVDKADL